MHPPINVKFLNKCFFSNTTDCLLKYSYIMIIGYENVIKFDIVLYVALFIKWNSTIKEICNFKNVLGCFKKGRRQFVF